MKEKFEAIPGYEGDGGDPGDLVPSVVVKDTGGVIRKRHDSVLDSKSSSKSDSDILSSFSTFGLTDDDETDSDWGDILRINLPSWLDGVPGTKSDPDSDPDSEDVLDKKK